MFSKKYWFIKRANMRIFMFKYFYSWQNALKFIFALIWGPIFLVFVAFPQIFFEWLHNFIEDNIPRFIKVDDNPKWLKMSNAQRREFMLTFKDWK